MSNNDFDILLQSWSDIDTIDADENEITFYCYDQHGQHVTFTINKNDSDLIAKHFNQNKE